MIKVSELTGAQLDYWVARAEGIPADQLYFYATPYTKESVCAHAGIVTTRALHYSTDWAQGGPLVAKYEIEMYLGGNGSYDAYIQNLGFAHGDTPLQAICRAVVRAAFGDEVEEVV